MSKHERAGSDKALNRIGRLLDQKHGKKFQRPSDESIHAYLMGTASSDQAKELTDAMHDSADFCLELQEMAAELNEVASLDYADLVEATPSSEVPDLARYIPRTGKSLNASGVKAKPSRSLAGRIREIMGSRLIIPTAFSVAALAILVYVQLPDTCKNLDPSDGSAAITNMPHTGAQQSDWQLTDHRPDKESLVRTNQTYPRNKDYSSAYAAAIGAFSSHVDFDNRTEQFQYRFGSDGDQSGDAKVSMETRYDSGPMHELVYEGPGQVIYKGLMPLSDYDRADNARLWIISFPSRETQWLSVDFGNSQAGYPTIDRTADFTLVTLTYRVSSIYRFTDPMEMNTWPGK